MDYEEGEDLSVVSRKPRDLLPGESKEGLPLLFPVASHFDDGLEPALHRVVRLRAGVPDCQNDEEQNVEGRSVGRMMVTEWEGARVVPLKSQFNSGFVGVAPTTDQFPSRYAKGTSEVGTKRDMEMDISVRRTLCSSTAPTRRLPCEFREGLSSWRGDSNPDLASVAASPNLSPIPFDTPLSYQSPGSLGGSSCTSTPGRRFVGSTSHATAPTIYACETVDYTRSLLPGWVTDQ